MPTTVRAASTATDERGRQRDRRVAVGVDALHLGVVGAVGGRDDGEVLLGDDDGLKRLPVPAREELVGPAAARGVSSSSQARAQ